MDTNQKAIPSIAGPCYYQWLVTDDTERGKNGRRSESAIYIQVKMIITREREGEGEGGQHFNRAPLPSHLTSL